jgi:HSP20 family protein
MSTPQRALQRQPQQLRFRKVESIAEDVEQVRQAVASRAFEIFSGRGSGDGTEIDDWVAAERELLFSPAIELTEDEGTLTLQVAIAGFKPDEFDVQLTPEDVLIQSDDLGGELDPALTVHVSDFPQGRLFREVHLPAPIEVDRAEARYRYGLLTITAPLAELPVAEEDVADFTEDASAEPLPEEGESV